MRRMNISKARVIVRAPARPGRSARAAVSRPRATPCRAEPLSRRNPATSTGAKMRCVALPRLGSPTSACGSDGVAELVAGLTVTRACEATARGAVGHEGTTRGRVVPASPRSRSRRRPAPPRVPRGVALARAGAHTATSRVRRSTVPNGRITSHRHPHHSVIIRSKDGAKTKRKPSRLRHFLTAHATTRTRIVFHSVLPYRATHRSPTRSAAARSSRSIPKSKICTAPTGPPCRRSSPWSPRS
jgi:hypothetical protein